MRADESDDVMLSHVAVAFSGGRDSTALLHATACAAREQGGVSVVALHVHHGLSAHADAWLAHARRTCDEWAMQGLPVRLLHRHVRLSLDSSESVEAAARQARYAALAEMAREAQADLVLLAHHRRDQAETFLLQALRGAGVSGLASMPVDIKRDGVRWVRPWLAHPREAIEAYVAQHGLHHVEDDSNSDTRFARNRLRLGVWPVLAQAFPQAEAALAGSATRVADVLPGLDAWRAQLLAHLHVAHEPEALDAVAWSELSGGERREALACWYKLRQGRALPASWVERLAHEVPGLVFRRQPAHWSPIGVSLYRGVLSCEVATWEGEPSDPPVRTLSIHEPGDIALPEWGGTLVIAPAVQAGVAPSTLRQATLRARHGGERFQAGPARPARSLKKQFQASDVPAWHRHGPLIFAGEKLVFVPGLGVDARCWAPSGEPQWALEWVPFGHFGAR
ncbi:MAG: tRNA lysidine(34) synthetase TilS [Aquabacterium sp.]